jgi:putative transcriptional regulator
MASEMTQAELGERIGVTRQTIAAIEAGKYSPMLETAFKIAEVFDKPLEEVFQWEMQPAASESAEANGAPETSKLHHLMRLHRTNRGGNTMP